MTADDDLAAALRRLRAEYLEAAPQRVAELWTAWARVQNDGVQALEGLSTLVHRLAGTGASYGLPAVTDRAREADEACRQMISARGPLVPDDMARLQALIQRIANAFQDASFSE